MKIDFLQAYNVFLIINKTQELRACVSVGIYDLSLNLNRYFAWKVEEKSSEHLNS